MRPGTRLRAFVGACIGIALASSLACSSHRGVPFDCGSSDLPEPPLVSRFGALPDPEIVEVPTRFDGTQPEPAPRITEIALDRTGCLGRCPIDSLRLEAGGRVRYTGIGCVGEAGEFRGTLPLQLYVRLAELAEQIGFFEMPDGYDLLITDKPALLIGITRDGQQKVVLDALGGPARLWAFELAVYQTLRAVEWDGPAPEVPFP